MDENLTPSITDQLVNKTATIHDHDEGIRDIDEPSDNQKPLNSCEEIDAWRDSERRKYQQIQQQAQ